MTSRLKRKLNDLGIDTASSRANENYCLIGTPLPPLEKSKDNGEFVPLWKQEVRDEKGRRRLHGAFTGGFSAGYFNSVGSKEGWTPSTFTSSRSDRTKAKQVRPEDFMDEEDLAELRESQKLVDISESMDLGFWGRSGRAHASEDDSLVSALQNALLPEPVDSAGGKILKKMGWRTGHGIGPKLSYEQQKREAQLAHSALGNVVQEPEDHEVAKKHMFPRRDTKIVVLPRKDDKHGVGFDSGADLNTIVSQRNGNAPSGPNISAGFGLGALNDADDDDVDVYDRGTTQSMNRRIAYDDVEEEHDRISIRGHIQKVEKPMPRAQSYFTSGVSCLPGFAMASEAVSERSGYPAPTVPDGWTADPRRVWEADKEVLKEVSRPMEDIKNLPSTGRRSGMTIDQRADVLGEQRMPKEKRSVFDYLSSQDRERLKNMASGHTKAPLSMPPVKEETRSDVSLGDVNATVPRLDAQIAKMALHGFQPFTADPVKQSRYTAYLKAQAAAEDSVPFKQQPGQSSDAFRRELEDFARSAALFKPVSGAMAGRFARASVIESGSKAVEGLHKPTQEGSYLSIPGENEEKEPVKEESPKENAARLGMYGVLTREVKPWIPAKLLCKRFGVREPEVELHTDTQERTASSTSQWQNGEELAITDGSAIGSTNIFNGQEELMSASATANRPKERDLSNIGFGDEDETQGQDLLTYKKPSIDIFKAIFASDEEDETETEDADEGTGGKPIDSNELPPESSIRNLPGVTVTTTSSSGQATPEIINIDSFKPRFVPRANRESKVEEKDGLREKEKKKRKKRTLVSFDVDEGEPPLVSERDKDRERAKKIRKKGEKEKEKKRDKGEGMDDDSMWVEKEAPLVVQNFVPPAAPVPQGDAADDAAVRKMGPPRGRKKAIDFM